MLSVRQLLNISGFFLCVVDFFLCVITEHLCSSPAENMPVVQNLHKIQYKMWQFVMLHNVSGIIATDMSQFNTVQYILLAKDAPVLVLLTFVK